MTEINLIEYPLVFTMFLFGCPHKQIHHPVLPLSFLDFHKKKIQSLFWFEHVQTETYFHKIFFIKYHNEFHTQVKYYAIA